MGVAAYLRLGASVTPMPEMFHQVLPVVERGLTGISGMNEEPEAHLNRA